MYFTGKNYKEYHDGKTTLKTLKTKYPLLELIISNEEGTHMKLLGKGYKTKFDMYLNHKVLSSCNYEDTYTTSVILWDKKMEV
jgi:hypothetical protein